MSKYLGKLSFNAVLGLLDSYRTRYGDEIKVVTEPKGPVADADEIYVMAGKLDKNMYKHAAVWFKHEGDFVKVYSEFAPAGISGNYDCSNICKAPCSTLERLAKEMIVHTKKTVKIAKNPVKA
jgi:hypothetical protein